MGDRISYPPNNPERKIERIPKMQTPSTDTKASIVARDEKAKHEIKMAMLYIACPIHAQTAIENSLRRMFSALVTLGEPRENAAKLLDTAIKDFHKWSAKIS